MIKFNFKYKNFLSGSKFNSNILGTILYDRTLIWLTLCLIIIGFVMVTSASMPIGHRLFKDPFFFAKRDITYLILSCSLILLVLNIPMIWWEKYSFLLLINSLLLLLIVLFAGSTVNGASRWINFGGIICIQPAEVAKLTLFCYISGYLVRRNDELQIKFSVFIKPICILILMAILLLLQPDLGTVIVLVITTLALLFLAGVRLVSFIISIIIFIMGIVSLIYLKSYRFHRIVSFLDPWADPFGSGYQLTQSLMAFGRGKLCGQGLGNSIQKLEYLPEAHTDFIFSVLAEELGYVGVVLVLLMLFFIVFRGMKIGKLALDTKQLFSGYLACSISIWIGFQILINIAATIGMLPTKGLTLPLISYGGSSLLITSIAIAILLRIDFETRLKKAQAFIINKRETK